MQENNTHKTMVLFTFSGQSIDWRKSLFLYNNDIYFKNKLDEYDKKLEFLFGFSMLENLLSQESDSDLRLNQQFTHGMLFIYQIALYEYIVEKIGILPNLIFGVSCGEVSAIYCSKMIDFQTASYILYNRSNFLTKTLYFGGAQIATRLTEGEFNKYYTDKYPNLNIVAFISKRSTVIGGKKEEVINFQKDLEDQKIHTKMINVDACFHSQHIEVLKEDVLKLDFESKNPSISVINCVNMKYFDNNYKYDKYHIYENLRNPCKIYQTYQEIFKFAEKNKISNIIVKEISPMSLVSGKFIIDDIIDNTDLKYLTKDDVHVIPSNYSSDFESINNNFNQVLKLYKN